MNSNKHLCVLLATAVILKGAILFLSQVIANDGPLYITQTQLLLEGSWRQALAMPLNHVAFPALIALMSFLTPDLEVAGRTVSFLASVLVVFPLYHLIAELFDESSAFFGTAAFLLIPRINQYAVDIMRDATFILVFVLALLFATRFLRSREIRHLFLCFLFSCFSILFRLEGFLFLLIFTSFLLISGDRANWMPIGLNRKPLAVVMLALATVGILAYFYPSTISKTLRIDEVYSRLFSAADGGYTTYVDEIKTISRSLKGDTLHSAWENDFFEIVADNIRTIYLIGLVKAMFRVLFPPFALIAIFGFFHYRRGGKEHLLLLISLVAYFLFSYLYLMRMNFISYRYLFPAAVLLCPWVGFGLRKLLASWSHLRFKGVILPLCCGVLVLWPAYESFGHLEDQMLSGKEAGRWLAAQGVLNEGDLLVANDGTAPFYAGQRWNAFLHLRSAGLEIARKEDWPKIEELSVSRNARIISLSLHRRKADLQPAFESFVLIKSFEDQTYRHLIFARKSS